MEAVDAALAFLVNLGLTTDHSTDWTEAVELARRFKLSIYDSAYLELAFRLDAPLATLDKALIAAATQLGRLASRKSLTP